jgi:exodeoxyribonuclease VIII
MAPIIAALRVAMRPYLTSTAQMERILTWTDEATGIRCKCRPDLFDPASRLVLDLKTTRSVDIRRFGHDVARYQYHGQVAHYSAGITAALGWTPEQHILIAVESAPPHDVATFPLDADTLRTGAEKVAALLAQLAECRATNTWPGRYPIPIPLGPANLPPWIFGGGIPEFAFEETA